MPNLQTALRDTLNQTIVTDKKVKTKPVTATPSKKTETRITPSGSAEYNKILNQLNAQQQERQKATAITVKSLDDKAKDNEKIFKAIENNNRQALRAAHIISLAEKRYTSNLQRQQRSLAKSQSMVSNAAKARAKEFEQLRKTNAALDPSGIIDITGTNKRISAPIIKRQPVTFGIPDPNSEFAFLANQGAAPGRKSSTIWIKNTSANNYTIPQYKTPTNVQYIRQPNTMVNRGNINQYLSPTEVELDTTNGKHQYKIKDSHSKLFKNQAEINARTHTASATGAALMPYDYRFAGKSAARGTAFHLLSELLDTGKISLQDLRGGRDQIWNKIKNDAKYKNSYDDLTKGQLFDNNGQINKSTKQLIEQRLQTLRYDNTGRTAYFRGKPAVELALGAITKLNGEDHLVAGALDRVIQASNNENELIVEDIKNKNTKPHPFTEATQLLTQAMLLESYAERLGIAGKTVRSGRIAQYNPKTGEESFRGYNIGSIEDLNKILLMNERLKQYKAERGLNDNDLEKDQEYRAFASKLANQELSPYYKKLFLEELDAPKDGCILSTKTTKIKGHSVTYPQFLYAKNKKGENQYSTLTFTTDKNGMLIPSDANHIYQNWKGGYDTYQEGVKTGNEILKTRGQNFMNQSMELIQRGLLEQKDAFAPVMVMNSMERLLNTDRATPEIRTFAQKVLDMRPNLQNNLLNKDLLKYDLNDVDQLEQAKQEFISMASEMGTRYGDIFSDPYGTDLYQLYGNQNNPLEPIAAAITAEQEKKKRETQEQEPEGIPGSYQDFKHYYDSIIGGIQSKDFKARWDAYKEANKKYYDNPTIDNYNNRENTISYLLDRGGINSDVLENFEHRSSVSHLSKMMGILDQNWAGLSEGDVEQAKRIFAGRLFNQYPEKNTEFNFARGFARNYFASDIYDTYGNKNLTPNQQQEKKFSQALLGLEQDVIQEYQEEHGVNASIDRIETITRIMDKLSNEYGASMDSEDPESQINFHKKYGEQGERLVKQYRYLIGSNHGELSDITKNNLRDAFSGVDLLNGGNKSLSTQNVYAQKDIYGNTGYDILNKFDTPLAGLMRVDRDTIAGGEQGIWAWVDNEGNIHRYDPSDTTAKQVEKAAKEEQQTAKQVKKAATKKATRTRKSSSSKITTEETEEERIRNTQPETVNLGKEQINEAKTPQTFVPSGDFSVNQFIDLKANKELRAYIQTYENLLRERNRILKESNKTQEELDNTDNGEYKDHLEERQDLYNQLLQENEQQLNEIKTRDYGGANDQGMRRAFTYLDSSYQTRNILELNKLGDKNFKSSSNKGGSNKQSKQGKQLGTLGDAVGGWVERLLTGGIWMKLFGNLVRGVRQVIDIAKQLDETMINLRVVTGLNQEQTYSLINSYAELGKQLGATTTQVANAANDWLRQGYAMSEVNDLVTASLYLSKLGMISTEEATKNLTSAIKGFKIEASSAMDIVDKLTAIDINAATSAGEIANGLAQFANLANMTGVDLDQAASYVATIADVTQMSGSSAGQAMKMILSRFGTVKSGKYNKINVDSETNDESTKLNDVETILNKMGIAVRKTNLEFRDFSDVLDDVAARWKTLDTVSKNAVATAFAGTRQREAFATLMENYDKYEDLLRVSEESKGTAERKYQSYMEQLTASMNKFQAAWEQFTNNAQVNKLLKDLTDGLTKIIEQLPKIIKYVSYLIIQTKGGSIMKSIGNKIFGLLGYTDKDGNPIDFRKNKIGLKATKNLFTGKGFKKAPKDTTSATQESSTITQAEQKRTEEAQRQLTIEQQVTEEKQKQLQLEKQKGQEQEQSNTEETISETQQTAENQQQLLAEKQQTMEDKQQTAQGATGNIGGSVDGKMLSSGKVAQISGWMTLLSYGFNQILSGLNAYLQTGATHTSAVKELGTVESSKEAEGAYKGISTAFTTAIPFVGQFIGDWIGEAVAKNIDRVRDEMLYNSQQAQERLSNLNLVKQASKTLSDLGASLDAEDVKQRNEAANEFLTSMYSKEGAATRSLLEKYLSEIYGEQVTLSGVMKKYTDGSEKERIEAAKKLEIAEKKARTSQIIEAEKSNLYNNEQEIKEAYKNYGSIDKTGAVWAGIGTGAGTTLAGAAAGAGIGAAVGSVVPIAGTLIGTILGGVAGLIGGIFTGKSVYSAAVEKKWQEEVDRWDNSDLQERIGIASERKSTAINLTAAATIAQNKNTGWQNDLSNILKEMIKSGEINESEYQQWYDKLSTMSDSQLSSLISSQQDLVESSDQMVTALQQYMNQQQAVIDQMNKAYVDLALTEAKSGDKYLTEMNISQLKNLGITGIYKAISDALESEGGLINIDTYDAAGNFTDAFISEVTSKLKEDEEIAAALRGDNYSLTEAFAKLSSTNQFDKQVLENFANALGITLDELAEQQVFLTEKYGMLTLGEMLSSTTDLETRTSSLISLTDAIVNGSGSISQWMGTISNQFPELLAYTSDVPTLMTKIIQKTKQLSEVYIQSQYADIAQSAELYDTMIRDAVESASGNAKDLLTDAGVTNIKELQTWLNSQDITQGDAKAIYEKLLEESQQ